MSEKKIFLSRNVDEAVIIKIREGRRSLGDGRLRAFDPECKVDRIYRQQVLNELAQNDEHREDVLNAIKKGDQAIDKEIVALEKLKENLEQDRREIINVCYVLKRVGGYE